MSYEIYYDKQFIKAQKGAETVYLPMVLQGSNNTYDCNWKGQSTRRSRDWNNFSYLLKGNNYGTAEEIMAGLERFRLKTMESHNSYTYEGHTPYNDESFGYSASIAMTGKHTSGTTFNNFKNFIKGGITNALTVEQLREVGISLSIYTSVYDEENLIARGLKGISLNPQTSDELIQMIDETEGLLDGVTRLYATIGASEYAMKLLKQKYFPRKPKTIAERKPVTEFYSVTINDGYFYKSTKYGFQYSPYNGKRFKTEKLAQKKANELIELYGTRKGKIEVEKITVDEPVYI